MAYQGERDGTVIRRATMAEGEEPSAHAGIDLEALADRVLALLKRELRVERERLGQCRTSTGGRYGA